MVRLADRELHDKMADVIEHMLGRKRLNQYPMKKQLHRGFVWGIVWIAHRLDFQDVKERGLEIMKLMEPEKEEPFDIAYRRLLES